METTKRIVVIFIFGNAPKKAAKQGSYNRANHWVGVSWEASRGYQIEHEAGPPGPRRLNVNIIARHAEKR